MKSNYFLLVIFLCTNAVLSSAQTANALNFDGTDDYVNLGAELGNFGTNDFTVELSFKTTNASQFIIAKRAVCNHASFWNLSVDEGKLVAEIDGDDGGSNYAVLTAPTTITDNIWHQVAIVRASALVTLYLDGRVAATQTMPATADLTNAAPLYLGTNGACGGRSGFDGSMDEVRIWNVARSAADIMVNYNKNIAVNSANLIAYYDFNQGIANGDNHLITALIDTIHFKNGLFVNFALSGANSNFIKAQLAPIAPPPIVPVPSASLIVDNALNFDGINDHVNMGTQLGNFGTADLTVEFSLKTTAASQFIMAKRPVCDHSSFWNLSIADSKLVLEVDDGITPVPTFSKSFGKVVRNPIGPRNYLVITAPNLITDNEWHHIAVTRLGKAVSVIIDGVLVETQTMPAVANLNNATPFYIGNNGACGGRATFGGSLDEIRIWKVARSLDELFAYKNEDIPATAPDLLAYYPCNQGKAGDNNTAITTLADISPQQKAGILTNFARTGAVSNFVSNYNTVVTYSVDNTSTATYIPPPGEEPTMPTTGRMTDADAELVLKWIAKQVAAAKTDYCYRQTYTRNVGSPLSACAPDQSKDGLLCYPRCRENYDGAGPVCWQNCPSGFRNDGAFCAKPAPYGRGAGTTPSSKCPKGYSNAGVACTKFCGPLSIPCGTANLVLSCSSDHELNGLLCYPKCQAGFKAVGCCICSPECPSGMTDIGVSCAKNSYGRGAGSPMICDNGREEDAGLCYTRCRPGYKGVGPVCWQNCPTTQPFDCVSGCARNESACAEKTANMAISPVVMVASILTFGTGGLALNASKTVIMASVRIGAKAAAREAARAATRSFVKAFEELTTKKVLQTMRAKLNTETLEWICAKYGQANLVVSMSEEFDKQDLWLLAGLDPTGAACVVEAYLQKKCDIDAPFPTLSRSYQ